MKYKCNKCGHWYDWDKSGYVAGLMTGIAFLCDGCFKDEYKDEQDFE